MAEPALENQKTQAPPFEAGLTLRQKFLGIAQLLSALATIAGITFPIARSIESRFTTPQITMVLDRVVKADRMDEKGILVPGQKLVYYELLNPGPGTLENVRLVVTSLCGDPITAGPCDATTDVAENPKFADMGTKHETPRQIVAVPAGEDKSLSRDRRIGMVVLVERGEWVHRGVEATWGPGQRRIVYTGNAGDRSNLSEIVLWVWWVLLALASIWWILYFVFFQRGQLDKAYAIGFDAGRAAGSREAASAIQQTTPEQMVGVLKEAMQSLVGPLREAPPSLPPPKKD